MLQLLGVWGRQAEAPADAQENDEDYVDEHDEVVEDDTSRTRFILCG